MKLIDNATEIRIPSGSVVIMTGLQGAGKTFFTEIFFDEENVICNDKIFWFLLKPSKKFNNFYVLYLQLFGLWI